MKEEKEFLNEGFKNYPKPGDRSDYVFMNEVFTKGDDKYESFELELEEELKNSQNRHKIINVTEKRDLNQQASLLAATASAVLIIGSMMGILLNQDLTTSITTEIANIGGNVNYRDIVASFSPANIITLSGTAITLAGTVIHGVKYKKYNKELSAGPIDILKVEEAKERDGERGQR